MVIDERLADRQPERDPGAGLPPTPVVDDVETHSVGSTLGAAELVDLVRRELTRDEAHPAVLVVCPFTVPVSGHGLDEMVDLLTGERRNLIAPAFALFAVTDGTGQQESALVAQGDQLQHRPGARRRLGRLGRIIGREVGHILIAEPTHRLLHIRAFARARLEIDELFIGIGPELSGNTGGDIVLADTQLAVTFAAPGLAGKRPEGLKDRVAERIGVHRAIPALILCGMTLPAQTRMVHSNGQLARADADRGCPHDLPPASGRPPLGLQARSRSG
ncbi:MAG: hypothetical protein EOM22_09940 [Gammaproteobacteria bacterium]|nr:hypothetical protein [Gammaproteobacteria bacterium]